MQSGDPETLFGFCANLLMEFFEDESQYMAGAKRWQPMRLEETLTAKQQTIPDSTPNPKGGKPETTQTQGPTREPRPGAREGGTEER